MKVKIILSAIILLNIFMPLLSLKLREEPYTKLSNVRYGNASNNLMDIYLPKKKSENFYGAILCIHGGGWVAGDKREVEFVAKEYAKYGYITATMNYQFVSFEKNITFYDELKDIELAIKKIIKVSLPLRYTINGLGLVGASAGAHLSLLFGYSRPEKSDLPIKFIVDLVGPADFRNESWGESKINMTGPELALKLTGINKKTSELPEEELKKIVLNVSPVNFITNQSIPTICGYALKDEYVPVGNINSIKAKYEKEGAKYDLFIFPNSSHSLSDDPDVLELLMKKFNEYTKKYFGY